MDKESKELPVGNSTGKTFRDAWPGLLAALGVDFAVIIPGTWLAAEIPNRVEGSIATGLVWGIGFWLGSQVGVAIIRQRVKCRLFREGSASAVPPRNVRLALDTGQVVSVECRYIGRDEEGMHGWQVIVPEWVVWRAGCELRTEPLPVNTRLVLCVRGELPQ